MDINKWLNIVLKFWTQKRKQQEKQDSKIAECINGSWYLKTEISPHFEEESIVSVQFNFNIEIIKMMLATNFESVLTPSYLTFSASRI